MLARCYKVHALGGRGWKRRGSTFAFDLVGDLVYLAEGVAVAVYEVGYLGGGVHDGGMVAAAEGFSYLGKRFVGEFAGEVHGDLARVGESFGAARADEVGLRDTEVAAHLVLDEFDRYLAVRLVRQDISEDLLSQGDGYLPSVERGVREYTHQGPFELPDVRRDLRGYEGEHLVVHLEAVHDRLLAQDGDARLEVRRLDIGHEPPLEAAHETVLEGLYVFGMPVGGDNDLLVLLVERVEGVEERLLGLDLVLQKLYVVHQEHVVLPVALLELQGRVIPHGVYEVVGELLAGHVTDAHAGVLILDVVAHGAQKMCLSEPDSPVDEERVVDEARGLRHRQSRRVGEPVAGPDDERVERVLDLEGPGRPGVQHRLGTLHSRRAVSVPRPALGPADAHDQGGILPEHGIQGLLEKRAEAALDVLLGEGVGDGDLQPVFVEVHRSDPFEPDPQGRDVYVLGGAIQNLGPDLFYPALHRLSDPGVDDGFYQIPPERRDDALPRFVRDHQPVLLEDREVAIGGADADLQPFRYRRRADLTAFQHRDQNLLLPLRDVHARHPIRVPPGRSRLRRTLLLRRRLLAGHGDGRHGTATDVVLDGHRTPHLLRRRASDAQARAYAPDLAQSLRRGT